MDWVRRSLFEARPAEWGESKHHFFRGSAFLLVGSCWLLVGSLLSAQPTEPAVAAAPPPKAPEATQEVVPSRASEAPAAPAAARLKDELERLQRQQEELDRVVDETERALKRLARENQRRLEDERAANDAVIQEAEGEAPRRPHRPRGGRAEQRFALGSSIRIAEGERATDVVAIGGGVNVAGEVLNGVVAVGGSVHVDGRVGGDVVAVGNRVVLGPNAVIEGDVTSVGSHVERAPGAQVEGDVNEVALGRPLSFDLSGLNWDLPSTGRMTRRLFSWAEWWSLFWRILWTGLLVVLCGFALVLMPSRVNYIGEAAAAEPWKCGLIGVVATACSLPAFVTLVIVLALSLIGIPLLVLVPFLVLGLIALSFVGYAGVAREVGQFVAERIHLKQSGGFVSLVLGVISLAGLSLSGSFLDAIGLPLLIAGPFKLFGFMVQLAAGCVGIGALVLSRIGSRPVRLP